MKTAVRIITVSALVLVMALPVVMARADEGEEVYAGYFVQEAVSGTMVDNGDGTYELALEGVGEFTQWLITSPDLGIADVNTGELVLNWTSHPDGLEGQGILEIGDILVSLTLTMPEFDATEGVVTYTAEVIVPESEKDAPEVPEAFDMATLYIVADTAFVDGLAVGAENSPARPTLQCVKTFHPILGWYDNCNWVP